jgi:hypothetical protein
MYNIIRKLLGLCEHEWKIIKSIDVYETWDGERYDGQLPAYAKIILQCKKCGDIKKKKI